MAENPKFRFYEPRQKDLKGVSALYKKIFGKSPKTNYFKEILNKSQNPFIVAYDKNEKVVGYVACRLNNAKGEVYIASMAEEPNSDGVILRKLLKMLVKGSKEMDVSAIFTHNRESSEEYRNILKEVGFKEQKVGEYKDGETKYESYIVFKKKSTIIPNTYRKRVTLPLPPPVEGKYTIRDAKQGDVTRITELHNKFLKIERKSTYFSSKVGSKNGIFLVALDSNKKIAGYIVCRPERKAGLKKGPFQRLNFISMAVDTDYRGWGIAKALITDMIDKAKQFPDIEYIYGHVRGKNKKAFNLYRRMGFKLKKIGTYKDDEDEKYELFMRIRYPSLKPYWLKYREPVMWIGVGIAIHEVLHLVRDYD
jgi:ribosomal protein S18 acetylase RimI-like enzyme